MSRYEQAMVKAIAMEECVKTLLEVVGTLYQMAMPSQSEDFLVVVQVTPFLVQVGDAILAASDRLYELSDRIVEVHRHE
jgi:hypothetical protein